MTPTDNDQTIIRPLAALSLAVRDPSGRTRRVPLASGQMVVGRGEDCTLVLESGDQAASRHHALITVDGPVVTVQDAGSTNGVFVNETKVERTMLRPGDVVRLGRTILTVEAAAPPPRADAGPGRAGARPSRRAVLYAAIVAVLGVALWLAVYSGDEAPGPQAPAEPAPKAQPKDAPAMGDAPAPVPDPAPAPDAPAVPDAATPPPGRPGVSPEDAEKSQEHARQAMFFYNSEKIGLAIGEWEKAVTLDPGNGQAAKWLARAEGERDQLLDKHYREGLAALKYSRREEAMEHFRFVAEHCREKTDERCLDADRQLGRLEGNKP
jgi:hypothetical protein